MNFRLKSGLYVQALLRRVQVAACAAYVLSRGDNDAGGIFVRVNRLDGSAGVLNMFTDMDGAQSFRVILPSGSTEAKSDALIKREMQRDPDLWVVDIEDARGRHFLEGRIEGDWSG
ncbi:MAG: DUF1491 family protein [Alphaproteobacteria bacterium]|nr:DUF1491 family protein [Alphaproteobacteria bacterium]